MALSFSDTKAVWDSKKDRQTNQTHHISHQ